MTKVTLFFNEKNTNTSINSFTPVSNVENGYMGVIKLTESNAVRVEIIEGVKFEYVVDGAELSCNKSNDTEEVTILRVSSQDKLYMSDELVATKKDNKPLQNIFAFKSGCQCGGNENPFSITIGKIMPRM